MNTNDRQEGGRGLHDRQSREAPSPSSGHLPLITVVTATFNAARYLPDTLRTLRAQDYPNLQWIVIDGASRDGTTDLLRANEDLIDYWLSEPDRGMYDALAKGFDKARGDILCWLNAGDILLPGALATVADIFQAHSQVTWITGIHFWHLPGCKIVGCFHPPAYATDLVRCGAYGKWLPYIQQESTFFRRSLLNDVDMERFRTFKLAGDLYLWSRFATHARLTLVGAGLGSFCLHEGQLSEDKDAYWREADTFLERISWFGWIRIMLRMPLRFAPNRIKRMVGGNGLLSWRKDGGWQ